MKEKYQQLAKTLEAAQAQARAVHDAGGHTGGIYRELARPIREVRQRITHIEDVEERAASAKKEKAKAKAGPAAQVTAEGNTPGESQAIPGGGHKEPAAK